MTLEDLDLLKLRFQNLETMLPAEHRCRMALVGSFRTIEMAAMMLRYMYVWTEEHMPATSQAGADMKATVDQMFDKLRETASAVEVTIMEEDE